MDLAILDYTVVTPGTYTLRLSTSVSADYQLNVVDNLVFDVEPNNSEVQPLRSLDRVAGALGYLGGTTREFQQYNDPSLFVDISGTGTALNLADDGEATITTTVGNAIFPSGATTVANNGGIIAAAGEELAVGILPCHLRPGTRLFYRSGTTLTPTRAMSIGRSGW